MINQILNFAKSDKMYEFLGEYEVTQNHILLADAVAGARKVANVLLGTEDKEGFSNGNAPRTYFMSLLTELHFSHLIQKNSNKKMILTLPDLISFDLQGLKRKNDCAIELNDFKVDLDIKSQYSAHKYKNVNINEGHLKKAKERGTIFIFSLINTNTYEEKEDFKNVKSISNYIVKEQFVSEFGEFRKIQHRYDGFYQLKFSQFNK